MKLMRRSAPPAACRGGPGALSTAKTFSERRSAECRTPAARGSSASASRHERARRRLEKLAAPSRCAQVTKSMICSSDSSEVALIMRHPTLRGRAGRRPTSAGCGRGAVPAVGHAIGARRLELAERYGAQRAGDDVGDEGAIDDAERDAGEDQILAGREAPVRGVAGWPRPALAASVSGVQTLRTTVTHSTPCSKAMREEQEEEHVGHAAHDVDVAARRASAGAVAAVADRRRRPARGSAPRTCAKDHRGSIVYWTLAYQPRCLPLVR